MREKILSLLFCLAFTITANAQKFALVDMEYIMENIPAYQKAIEKLESASQKFQKEVETKAQEAENLYKAYQQLSASISATQRTQKEEAIIAKEKETAELRKKYFGPEGEMAKQQDSLLTPIQDQIYEAIKEISLQRGYDMVVDRASAMSIVFATPNIDISNDVLIKLGYSK